VGYLVGQFARIPKVVCDTSGRSHAQRAVNLDKVKSDIIQRNRCRVILDLGAGSLRIPKCTGGWN
jgi:hypothetical protein